MKEKKRITLDLEKVTPSDILEQAKIHLNFKPTILFFNTTMEEKIFNRLNKIVNTYNREMNNNGKSDPMFIKICAVQTMLYELALLYKNTVPCALQDRIKDIPGNLTEKIGKILLQFKDKVNEDEIIFYFSSEKPKLTANILINECKTLSNHFCVNYLEESYESIKPIDNFIYLRMHR